jgi:hypothetical protein
VGTDQFMFWKTAGNGAMAEAMETNCSQALDMATFAISRICYTAEQAKTIEVTTP